MKNFFKSPFSFLLLFLSIDVLIILLHLIFPQMAVFHLDYESNLPTIYQGSKLIFSTTVSLLIVCLIYLKKGTLKREWFWVLLAGMTFFLGIDEIGQLHENISTYMKEIIGESAVLYESSITDLGYASTTWLPYYIGPFIVLTLVVAYFIFRFMKEKIPNVWMMAVGWGLFLLAIAIEYVNTMPHIMFQEGYNEYVIAEESLEIFGATFILAFAGSVLTEKMTSFRKA